MPERKQTKQEKLQALRDACSGGLGERLAKIVQCWAEVQQSPQSSEQTHMELHRHVHSLAGSAETFGYQRLGRAARALEKLLSESDSASAQPASASAAGYGAANELIQTTDNGSYEAERMGRNRVCRAGTAPQRPRQSGCGS